MVGAIDDRRYDPAFVVLKESNSQDTFLALIYSYLSNQDLVPCARVCKRWQVVYKISPILLQRLQGPRALSNLDNEVLLCMIKTLEREVIIKRRMRELHLSRQHFHDAIIETETSLRRSDQLVQSLWNIAKTISKISAFMSVYSTLEAADRRDKESGRKWEGSDDYLWLL